MQDPRHELFMREAMAAASANPRCPFGAVLVVRADGRTVATGVNRTSENPVWHGEVDVINRLAAADQPVDWSGLDLYTTAEPCPMCQAAILWARIPRVIYGTSIDRLSEIGWNQIAIPSDEMVRRTPFADCEIVGGVLGSECDQLFLAALNQRG